MRVNEAASALRVKRAARALRQLAVSKAARAGEAKRRATAIPNPPTNSQRRVLHHEREESIDSSSQETRGITKTDMMKQRFELGWMARTRAPAA